MIAGGLLLLLLGLWVVWFGVQLWLAPVDDTEDDDL